MEEALRLFEEKVSNMKDPKVRKTASAYLKLLRGEDVDLSEVADPIERIRIAQMLERTLSENDIQEALKEIRSNPSLRFVEASYRLLSEYFTRIGDSGRADLFEKLAEEVKSRLDEEAFRQRVLKEFVIYLDRVTS